MAKPDGGPAFPLQEQMQSACSDGNEWLSPGQSGMSLRDYFAGQALAGMMARDMFDSGQATPEQRAQLAYRDADAMLVAREPQKADAA